MSRRCEICENLAAPAGAQRELRRVLVGERILLLCKAHADFVRKADVAKLEELRALLQDPAERRSPLSRRSPLDRRVFPARPEGRRGTNGRRASDRDAPR